MVTPAKRRTAYDRAPRSEGQSAMSRLAALLVVALLSPVPAAQIYIDDDAPADPGPGDPLLSDPLEDGSLAHPFDSLAEAIAAFQLFDQIVCQPGRYTGPGNGGLVSGKNFNVRGLRGADETIFDLQHASPFLTLTAQSSVLFLEGLTIANGEGVATGGIETLSKNTELLITSCVLRENRATGTGTAGGALLLRGSLDCSSTAFLANASAGRGGAIAIAADSTNVADQDLVMCTFRGNRADGDGGAIWADGTASVPLFVRTAVACIFHGNEALGGLQDQIGESVPGNYYVADCVVEGGWAGLGVGNLDVDPQFAFPGTFHLSVVSPVQDLTGGLLCTIGPYDADGQQRDCGATELGADEIVPVTLASGAGARIELAVAGATPGLPARMLLGDQLVAPVATPFGLLELPAMGLRVLAMPSVGADGTSSLSLDLGAVAPGKTLVLQGMVGSKLLPATTYTLH